MNEQDLKFDSLKIQQFVHRYEEEFDSKILFGQLLANIFLPEKRREIILKNLTKERIYTSQIDIFSKMEVRVLEEYLKSKNKKIKTKRRAWFYRNLIYVTIFGTICGVLVFVSKLNLLWILPGFLIYLVDVFKKSKNWGQRLATYTMLIYWIAAYKLRKNNQ